MSNPFVTYESSGGVATLTFDRSEQRNAIGEISDCDDIVAGLQRANEDPSVSVLILTGAGSAFSAGGNIKNLRDRRGIGPRETPALTRANYKRGVQRIPLMLAELEIATIAAVNGPAIGLGCDLACFCDIRIAADTARFAASFVMLGLVPGDGGAWILPRVVGYSRAVQMLLTGQTLDAATALQWGLVSEIVVAQDLMPRSHAVAKLIVANPAQSVRLAKRLLRESQRQSLPELLELSAAFQALAHETKDHAEAVAAALEKRPPTFIGR